MLFNGKLSNDNLFFFLCASAPLREELQTNRAAGAGEGNDH
jgi:hypothetical protein